MRAPARWMVTLIGALLLGPLLVVPSSTAASAREASLTVTPASGFVAGQRLTLRGNIGTSGKHKVHVEFHMGRPGDIWRVVPGSEARTRSDGSFTLHTPAPSMRGITYRVRSGWYATPGFGSHAVTPEVDLSVERHDGYPGSPVVGQPYTLIGQSLPAMPGRTLTLQRRVGSYGWETILSGPSDADGKVRFSMPAPSSDRVVYRVRAEDWTGNGDRVGWMPSFPLYVSAGSEDPQARESRRTSGVDVTPRRAAAPPQVTAHSTYKWGRHLFNFDWEYGESLSSKPIDGTRPRGNWLDASDGSGRVSIYNGAMQIEAGPDAIGSTWAVLRSNAHATGRWETRAMSLNNPAPFRIELVPATVSGAGCVARSITIARVDPAAGTMSIGAKGRSGSWSRTWSRRISDGLDAFGVEVTKRSIRWFIDGRPVGRLIDPKAVPGVKLTMRMVLEGHAGEASRTRSPRAMFDWARSAPLGPGRKARGGTRVLPGALPGCG